MKKKRSIRNKRVHKSNQFLIVAILVIVAVVIVGKYLSQKQSSQDKNVLGALLAKGGDDSDDDSSGGSGSSGSGSSDSGSSSSGSSESDSSGNSSSSSGTSGGTSSNSNITPTRTRVINPTTGFRTETETKQDEERIEVRLSETERIRTRTKDGRIRIDITAGGIKTRLEIRDGRIVIKAEQEDGTEVELADDTIFKIEERLATDQIKIATDAANRIVVQRGNTGAVSQFPLSIDLATNTLIVTTPSGVKTVTVLPDQAVQNLLVTNVVSRLGGGTIVNAFRTGEVTTLSQVIALGEKNGVPIYEINGLSDQKLLGFIPVSIPKVIEVSAETGEVLSTQTPVVNQVLDLISF